MAITSIENLSAEIFYEIFDYLDGCGSYKAFSNLNHHFQQLLNASSLLFKINFDSTPMNKLKRFIPLFKHKIISFHARETIKYAVFLLSIPIDSSFDRLQSLTLNIPNSSVLDKTISNLTSLPRLYSLTVQTMCPYYDFGVIYQLIFTLPKLKYAKCSAVDYDEYTYDDEPIQLQTVTHEQFSSIEHLIIDHKCYSKLLFGILSYTPQLRYLKCQQMHGITYMDTISSITMSNLSYISMTTPYYMSFEEVQWLISNLNCDLKVLRIKTRCASWNYFEADRLEALFSKHLPQLKEFDFQYAELSDLDCSIPTYSADPNQFISPFWIEQKWLLDIEMGSFDDLYSIRPYKYIKKEAFLLKESLLF